MRSLAETAPQSEWAVATDRLVVRYGRDNALDMVDLRVPEGAVYVLAGANGAGKSSAMRVLLNLQRPQSGRAEVFGLDSGASGPLVRAQIGYMPDAHDHALSWMTGARLIRHVAVHYPRWDAAYAARMIEAFDLDLDRKIGSLSKGEGRRLQFVLALAHRPPLLLLDEPTDGLDPLVRNQALALLAEHLADSPATVLLTTHHIAEVDTLADHLGVLRNGRLVTQMSRDELRRGVLRYRAEVPDPWSEPAGLRILSTRRSSAGREREWVIAGGQDEITASLAASGATVHRVTPLTLEEAALAFLGEEGTP